MRRKAILYFVVVVLLVSLLTGCNGNGVVPPLPEDIPVELIREYTGRDQVVRWADGEVSVCDITNNTKEIWDKINAIIDGPVFFKLTDDTMALIGIEYYEIEYPFFAGGNRIENFVFLGYGVGIHPTIQLEDTQVFTQICLTAAGIQKEKAAEGFSENIKEVLYWLYRLEPGYSLI